MDQPPVLTAARVTALVCAALNRAEPLEVRLVDEGGEHLTWLAADRYVARFAVGAEGSLRQRREVAVRDLVRERMPVAVPRSVAVGAWAPGATFTVDERLPGVSGERRPVGATGAGQLAGLLLGLRTVPATDALALGVPRQAVPDLTALADRAAGAAARLAAHGQCAEPLPLHLLDGAVPNGGTEALLHGDLKGEHLLVTEDGAISGVLDWTDSAVGDPATDIAGLAISLGASRAARVAERAGYAPACVARALHLARCHTLLLLDERLNGTDDSPEPLLRRQLARAWDRSQD